MNVTAFGKANPFGARINAIFSSDIGHFDVPDMLSPVPEAYELVEDELITSDDFRDFTFTNAVRLWGQQNPRFFEGTVVAKEAAAVLNAAPDARRRRLAKGRRWTTSETARLILRRLPRQAIEAGLSGDLRTVENHLGAKVPVDLADDPAVLRFALAQLAADPDYLPWSVRALILKEFGRDGRPYPVPHPARPGLPQALCREGRRVRLRRLRRPSPPRLRRRGDRRCHAMGPRTNTASGVSSSRSLRTMSLR